MALSIEELDTLMTPYPTRSDNLKKDIARQINVFNAIYDILFDANAVIFNAGGNSNLSASTEGVRLVQMGYSVYETDYKFTPGVRGFSKMGKCVIVSVSGSGNEKIADKVRTIYRDSEEYGIPLDLTPIGISTMADSPLKKVCDEHSGVYFVITANNKASHEENTDLCHYMGEDAEKMAQVLLNLECRLIAKEKGITEQMMREGHNPWF